MHELCKSEELLCMLFNKHGSEPLYNENYGADKLHKGGDTPATFRHRHSREEAITTKRSIQA